MSSDHRKVFSPDVAQNPPIAKTTSDFLRVATRSSALIREMVLRDIKGGHAGHGLGSLWIYAQPMVVVATYMLIFGVVIGSKMAITDTFPGDYTSYILVGLTAWLVMSGVLGRATNAFSGNANLVKQVVFPIETLPISSVVACFLIYAPTFALMLAYKVSLRWCWSCRS